MIFRFIQILGLILTMGLTKDCMANDVDSIIKDCDSCHGKNGNSEQSQIPTIAGISEIYFLDSMQDFVREARPASSQKRDGKPDTDMKRIVADLDKSTMKLLSVHYSKQNFIRKPQEFDANSAKIGKKHFLKYCEKCHEDAGRSSADDAGILAGQKKQYLTSTLEEILSGERTVSKKMKKKLDRLIKKSGDKSIHQLIEYMVSQQ